jgi:hypothetical protein
MQLPGKINDADLKDIQKVARSRFYWLKFLLANGYGIAVLGAITWATILALRGRTTPNWNALTLTWVVIAGIVVWAFYSSKKKSDREFTQLNAALPEQVDVTDDGLHLAGPNGAKVYFPWNSFVEWREGQRVILIRQRAEKSFVVLPVAQLSQVEREPIRQLLRTHLLREQTRALAQRGHTMKP